MFLTRRLCIRTAGICNYPHSKLGKYFPHRLAFLRKSFLGAQKTPLSDYRNHRSRLAEFEKPRGRILYIYIRVYHVPKHMRELIPAISLKFHFGMLHSLEVCLMTLLAGSIRFRESGKKYEKKLIIFLLGFDVKN